VTGPASVGIERGSGAPSRSTGTQGAVGAVLFVLALGLVLRLIIAQLLPGSGFGTDLSSFRGWAIQLASKGLSGFYDNGGFIDYTPGYLYVLWILGIVGSALGGVSVALVKVPAILADLAIGWLVWSMILELGGRRSLALAAAFVAVVNPITWFDSVVWGQVDSVGVVFLLLGVRDLWRDRPERAAIFAVVAALIKPQLGILIPVLALVTIRRAFWPVRDPASAVPLETNQKAAPVAGAIERFLAWERRTDDPLRVVTTSLVALITTILMCLPFGLSVFEFSTQAPFFKSGLIARIFATASGYPYLTVNAYNPWALVSGDTGSSLANSGGWICDGPWGADHCNFGAAMFGPVQPVLVGTVLMVLVALVLSVVAAWRPDRLTILVSVTVLALAFYIVPTRVHERYAYPVFALAIMLAAFAWRWRVAYLLLSITVFANMYAALTETRFNNPGISDWLGLGPAVRSEPWIVVLALVNGLVFLWALAQVRARALERLAEEVAAGSEGEPWFEGPAVPEPVPLAVATGAGQRSAQPLAPAPSSSIAVAFPTWRGRPSLEEAGIRAWFRGLLETRSMRPDRSRSLFGERGGRLDRLDLWFLVVVVVAAMGLRTFRLAEPYQMHFDEVYHARTATEFLQDWRYGLSHDIYEWTHPHLAKYAMAGGIVLFGRDGVSATSDLGVPVTASVVEPRRDDPLVEGRAGERLHVATGSEIRTFDLRTRALIGVMAAPGATALAMSSTGQELIIGYDDGRLATVDVEALGTGDAEVGLAPVALGPGVGSPVDLLLATDDGATLLVGSGDRLSTVDVASGAVTGQLDLPRLVDLAPGGTGSALVATPSEIDDPATVAATLATLIGGDAGALEAKMRELGTTVVLGSPGDSDTRTKIETAIGDGSLPGIEITEVSRVAAATADGVTFVDPATASVIDTIPEEGGAHGLALITDIDDPKIYASVGAADAPEYDVIAVGGDQAKDGPTSIAHHPLPGPSTKIIYDRASQQVHILGLAPDASGEAGPWTVYVVEPHANAVYADARLPDGFNPVAWSADIEPDYPSGDRQQLLLFSGSGASASIDVGSHAFAWRFPGVIAGALTAGLIYLLARILFRRRLVAGLVAVLVIADGMFFVQSRIGMNDVYVGLFIVAAYTLFAALWTGWWRNRWAFWLAMPAIGLLMGLALASKWVAAYAIGALVLLILVRSALGRVVAIMGMIGITAVLGYLAITVPEGQGFGNLTFLLIMMGLTLIGVIAAILHPVAWTDDEMRLAVAAPVVLGTIIFLVAVAVGSADGAVTVGPLAVTPVEVALVLALGSGVVAVLFWLGGGVGFGPLAGPPAPGDPASFLDAPAPAPSGWLRPGWLLGLPVAYAAACLVAVPLAVYVISYIPWAMIEGHQLVTGWPTGHNGQTLLDLTGQMYRYHNGLTAAHPASSPWWAWPLNLKPVWFYQEGLAAGTSAALYDAGSLVIWWLGVPALAFVGYMAFKRRSLALTLIAVGFAAQWVPWARIDRAAFQYHYYTALPFVVLALAYLLAEVWHGASRRTWQLARIAAAIAIMGPALMWLFDRPLCALVGVESVNPGSAACPAYIPTAVITTRTVALAIVVGGGLVLLIRQFLLLDDREDVEAGRNWRSFVPLTIIGLGVAIGVAFVSRMDDTAIVTLTNVPVEPIALVVLMPLAYLAIQVVGSRDPRRFVVGFVVAAVSWFVILYPNISALPLPSAVVAAYQGILPTYLYAFQFPVSTVDRSVPTPLLTPMFLILTVAIAVTCLVVAYSTWTWRLSLAEPDSGSADEDDALARTGGGA
jgi:Gpi18-like mannosyltransferase/predicted membrane-bound dolichyl-phosphate-mannose-protein mannosyltransferase